MDRFFFLFYFSFLTCCGSVALSYIHCITVGRRLHTKWVAVVLLEDGTASHNQGNKIFNYRRNVNGKIKGGVDKKKYQVLEIKNTSSTEPSTVISAKSRGRGTGRRSYWWLRLITCIFYIRPYCAFFR